MNNNDKSKIKHHFNKAHKTYDAYCIVQNSTSKLALELLLQYATHFKKIADFACGTGESTLKLIQHIHYKECYAIDFSDRLLSIAANKLPFTINCILSDFEEPLFPCGFLDLIFCNMGLQWAVNLEKTLSLFHDYLEKDGFLMFSIPMAGNFPEIKSEFRTLLFSNEHIIQTLDNHGFTLIHYYSHRDIQFFQSHYDALKSLQAVGANFSPRLYRNNKGLKKINVRELFVEHCNFPQLTYQIGIYLCQKISL